MQLYVLSLRYFDEFWEYGVTASTVCVVLHSPAFAYVWPGPLQCVQTELEANCKSDTTACKFSGQTQLDANLPREAIQIERFSNWSSQDFMNPFHKHTEARQKMILEGKNLNFWWVLSSVRCWVATQIYTLPHTVGVSVSVLLTANVCAHPVFSIYVKITDF